VLPLLGLTCPPVRLFGASAHPFCPPFLFVARQSVRLPVRSVRSLRPSVSAFVDLFARPPVCPSACSCVRPPMCSFRPLVCLSVCPSIRPSVRFRSSVRPIVASLVHLETRTKINRNIDESQTNVKTKQAHLTTKLKANTTHTSKYVKSTLQRYITTNATTKATSKQSEHETDVKTRSTSQNRKPTRNRHETRKPT
jgi:hypothetical protein